MSYKVAKIKSGEICGLVECIWVRFVRVLLERLTTSMIVLQKLYQKL